MANQILAGAVINAGMVIAGVDANNPPVTEPAPAPVGLQYPLLGSDGPVHIEGDFSIVQDGATSWTFEVEFTAPNDNQYRNIFTLGGTSDKNRGALVGYTTNSGDAFTLSSSSSGTSSDGYSNWLWSTQQQGWVGAPHRLTIIRDADIGRTSLFKDGVFVSTHEVKSHPTSSSSVKWPASHFEGADLTFFAFADDSVTMGDGTGVEIHGWNFSKTNTYADQGVTGLGGTITNLLPLTQTAPETPNPYVDPYAGDFIMASPSGRAITWNGGYDAIDMLQWISYGTWGENGTRSINTPGGSTAIHHMRYDPVSKRVFALFTGGEVALEDNGFGGFSTSNSSDDFFTGYYVNNVTWASPTMIVAASRNQYEPEDIPGLDITWNGTSWTKAAPANVDGMTIDDWTIIGGNELIANPGGSQNTEMWWRRNEIVNYGHDSVAYYEISNMQPGESYELTFEVKLASGSGYTGVEVHETADASSLIASTYTSGGYQSRTLSWTQPAGLTVAYMHLVSQNSGGIGEMRDAVLTKVS